MTVYPLIIHLGPLTITGFGLMVMSGYLMAGWAMQQELRRRQLDESYASDIVVATVIGGMLGAKLWYVALKQDPSALFSGSGFVWYGGFAGGFLAAYLNGRWRKVPTRFTMDLVAPALAMSHSLGRVGCYLVQDDYGLPTTLPWAMKFPEGSPPSTAYNLSAFGVPVAPGTDPTEVLAVHPTQLYEVAALMLMFWVLWRLRVHRHAVGWLFAVYLLLVSVERFLMEFLRAKDDRLLGTFTVAQAASVLVGMLGVALLIRWWREDDATRKLSLAVLKVSRQKR